MPKRVRNPFGVESVIPDDYPQDLIRQLGLEEVQEEGSTPAPAQEEPPKEERRRRR
ncbi:hypothetical protein [Thermus albus]|uniref:hypothetical protein n=1 Tax=Thermus albus TaxID=2908146 RepID=UPI001FAAD152|nr:hypothetical protein [Thermus albus]